MAIHYQAFREELYFEHLEEAAFRYDTRLVWLEDPDISWQELEELDRSIEAHLDALIVGGTLALKVCLDHIDDADSGMLHIIVRLYCRYQLSDRLTALWKQFDFDDSAKIRAVADALKWESPSSWIFNIARVFSGGRKHMYPILAPCVASLGNKHSERLFDGLSNVRERDLPILLTAISRSQHVLDPAASAQLADLLHHSDTEIAYRALVALLMLGESRALARCNRRAGELAIAFALGGDHSSMMPILALAKSGKANADIILALGIAGVIDGVPPLLAYLKKPELAETAATALKMISGADLIDVSHEPDLVEEDELFDGEIEAFLKGDLPKNIEGEPYGVEKAKVSTDYQLWFNWFKEHKARFKAGQRYRNGELHSASVLLRIMLSDSSSAEIREYAYEELVIRYAIPLPFASDNLIYKQKQQLNDIHSWLQKNSTSTQPGRWYFGGKELA